VQAVESATQVQWKRHPRVVLIGHSKIHSTLRVLLLLVFTTLIFCTAIGAAAVWALAFLASS
jgi:hypothetical protein